MKAKDMVIGILLEYRASVIKGEVYDTGQYAKRICQLFPSPLLDKDLGTKAIDILHRHYYPTLHEQISDVTLIKCWDEIYALLKEAK